jgi:DsbC/DsbD-like thiol-disulfide interchange protein
LELLLMRIALTVTLALLMSSAARAADKDLVKAELLADVSAVKPGEKFNVGVLLRIKPEWHVYWKNPGESGVATKVKITSSNANVGEARFPVPIIFEQPGEIIGYGYEKEVMFIAPVQVPQDAKGGSEITIAADTSWLSCAEVCIPGKAKLETKVRVADAREKANEEIFLKWHQRIPFPAERLISSGRISADPIVLSNGAGRTRIHTTFAPDELKPIPAPPEGYELEIGEPRNDNGTFIPIEARAFGTAKPGDTSATILLIAPDGATGYELTIPITQRSAATGPAGAQTRN